MKILIIEDEEILSKVLRDKFKSDGWDVEAAKNGEEGMTKIKTYSYEVVLLDLLLPRKDGFEVLRETRADPAYKDLPIIVISNLGGEDDIQKAMKLGANDYLVKTRHSLKEIVAKARSYIRS